MEKQLIIKLNRTFEDAVYEQDGIEYWLARELQFLLGYTEWRNFLNAIEKAKESCKTTGEKILDHFVSQCDYPLLPVTEWLFNSL